MLPEIPFDFTDGFILIKAQVAGEPVTLLLDSGAGASVLSVRAANRLHLHLAAGETVRGVGTEAPAWQFAPLRARAGDIKLAPIGMAIDLSNADDLCSQLVDGLLGVDFFAGRTVQIDFPARRIRLLSAAVADRASTRLPLKKLNGILCVPVALNGSQPRLTRLDTGCNDSLHWVLPRSRGQAPRRQVSIGFVTDPQDTMLGTVQLGDQSLHPVEVSLHTEPLFPGEAGLLGIGILSRYLVTVDAVHRELVLQTPSTGPVR